MASLYRTDGCGDRNLEGHWKGDKRTGLKSEPKSLNKEKVILTLKSTRHLVDRSSCDRQGT